MTDTMSIHLSVPVS